VPMSIAASFTIRHGIKIPHRKGIPPPAVAGDPRYARAFEGRSTSLAPNMTGPLTISVRSADFQRAFVALRYFWGARGAALGDGFEQLGMHAAAADVLSALSHPERAQRAQALGVELGRLATALEQRSLLR
jgi:hypothetical protein